MNRRNVVITEDELIVIRRLLKIVWLIDKNTVVDLLNSLPLPDHEMEIEE